MYVMYIYLYLYIYINFHLYTVLYFLNAQPCIDVISNQPPHHQKHNETMAPDRFVTDVELTLPMELGSWASTEHPLSALGNLTWITWKRPVGQGKKWCTNH